MTNRGVPRSRAQKAAAARPRHAELRAKREAERQKKADDKRWEVEHSQRAVALKWQRAAVAISVLALIASLGALYVAYVALRAG